jgi:O-antigen ligase
LLAGVAVVATGLPLLLTYSRGAWVGAFAGVIVVVLLRRWTLIFPLVAVGTFGLWQGVGSGFVERLWLGFTLRDPATKLRISEYRNAWEIIQRHPWFGVGYGDAPSLELQTGVSSAYLTIAEQAGLVGLTVFLIAAGAVLWLGLRRSIVAGLGGVSDLSLCFTAAFVAQLTVALVDHYFVNPQFPHMVALFWVVAAVVVALAAMPGAAAQQSPGVVS